ncbi:MAG: thiamine-phosphate pyrophosphorylase [Candidatus Omnitrophota bacterium]
MKKAAYRILDANLNRCREGLRVCEEIGRFVMNSKTLASELKRVRHSVASAARGLGPGSAFALSRDAGGDVGRLSRIKSERTRHGFSDIFAANLQRVKESLRVLEEFAKLIDEKSSRRFEVLRFRVYEIEKRSFKRVAALRHLR